MSTAPKTNLYRILLLTICQEDEENWRFLIEDPRTGERRGFAGLDSLVDGLQDVMDENQALGEQTEPLDSAQSPGC